MPYEMFYMAEGLLEGALSFGGAHSVLGLVSYVFCALSLYTIADRRGIRKPWLAWVPVVNVWILGSISDQYRYVAKGQVKNKRKVLLAVQILNICFSVVAAVRLTVALVSLISGMTRGFSEQKLLQMLLNSALSSLLYYLPVMILGIVGLVFEIMALYDVYTSCQPANNVLYLVLSIVPGISQVAKPLFLFLSRNQDGGMPPRRTV